MDQDNPGSVFRLVWIGAPLRKRLDETLHLPIPWELARLMAACEAALADDGEPGEGR